MAVGSFVGLESSVPQAFVVVYNDTDEDIPPFAACKVASVDENGYFFVVKPDETGMTGGLVFNGPAPIFAGTLGQACMTLPGLVRFSRDNPDDEGPQAGQTWGTRAESWELVRHATGFVALRDEAADAEVALFGPLPVARWEVIKTTSTTKTSGRYPAKRIVYDAAEGTQTQVEDVWYVDLGNAAAAATGSFTGRHVGYANGRPVYVGGATAVGGVTVRDIDSTPNYTGVTIIEFDQADGFVITNPAAGRVRIDFSGGSSGVNVKGGTTALASFAATVLDLDPNYLTVTNSPAGEANIFVQEASASVGGVLTNTTQSVAGAKTFIEAVTVQNQGGLVINNTSTPTNTTSLYQSGNFAFLSHDRPIAGANSYVQIQAGAGGVGFYDFFIDSTWAATVGLGYVVGGNPVILLGENGTYGIYDPLGTHWGDAGKDPAGTTYVGGIATNVPDVTHPSGGATCVTLPQSGGDPTGIASNTAGIYSKDVAGTCELYSFDEAGNFAIQSPHAMDGPRWLYDDDDPLPRVFYEENVYLGVRRWTNQSRQARLLERMLAGEDVSKLPERERTFIHVEHYEPLDDWDGNQQRQVAARAAEIAAQAARRKAAEDYAAAHPELLAAWMEDMAQHEIDAATADWLKIARPARPTKPRDPAPFSEESLEPYTPKPMPAWLATRLATKRAATK